MRFSGRIRFENVRDDLDALLEVTDTHVRLVSGEESLGSWCLADVVANRLISDEFELDLDGEVVIFVADDQVNFAYGAVQRMAEGWARFHSMNLVRRKRAMAQARRQNDPNRLDSVRKAFVSARDTLRTPAAPLLARREDETAPPQDEAPARPDPIERPPVDHGPVQEEEAEPAATSRFWDRVEKATAADADAPEGGLREPADTPAEAPAATRDPETSRPGRLRRLDAFPRSREERPAEEEAETPAEKPDESPTEADSVGVPTDGASPELRFEVPTRGQESSQDEQGDLTGDPIPPRRERRKTQETVEVRVDLDQPAEEVPIPAEVPSGGPSPELGAAEPRASAYRGGRHPSETSGWRAGLRSLFSRSDGEHEHSFVESTTPAGITRRVCLDCGHVSIGVSDDAT